MSRKKAIDLYCKNCGGSDDALTGTWRMKVRDCSHIDCSLYIYRPLPKIKRKDDE
jgi:hypothetical protein